MKFWRISGKGDWEEKQQQVGGHKDWCSPYKKSLHSGAPVSDSFPKIKQRSLSLLIFTIKYRSNKAALIHS